MTQYDYEIFADYYQFYLQDEQSNSDLSKSWTRDATDKLLATALGVIGVGTVRNMSVPVTVKILESALNGEDLSDWDQVNDCSIDVPSGRLVVTGCTDYFPTAARITVPPGTYRARIYYGNLDTFSENGLEGEDKYEIVLWLGEKIEPRVLKKR